MSFVFILPFFWAFISMFVWVIYMFGAAYPKFEKSLERYPFLTFLIALLGPLGPIMLVLPFCPQPRFEAGIWHWWIGSIIFITGVIVFLWGTLLIKKTAFKIADEQTTDLRTTGLHGIVRHPMCLGALLFFLGSAIMFRSYIGIALLPFWWLAIYMYTILEERSLEQIFGQSYQDYQKKVPGRIIPGLPF